MMKRFAAILVVLAVMLVGAVIAQDDDMMALVNVAELEDGTRYLVDADGMTLYLFAMDDAACTGGCLENWPPLTVESMDELTQADDLPGVLGIFTREDGTMQVTYEGKALYNWINDAAPGDTTGDGVNDVWFIVEPVMVGLGGSDDLGAFLVGANGMTLYLFAMDDTTCVDRCLENWPPLLVETEDELTVSLGVPGEFGFLERGDLLQVTYEGAGLYFWVNDAAPGDTTGHEVNSVWYVVPPVTVGIGGSDELGEFLVGAGGMTLYLFAMDDTACVDQCLVNWPPLLVESEEAFLPSMALMGEFGFLERGDMLQVTYAGKGLYYWINDVFPGDTTGQGSRDVWFVVSPDGEAVLGE